MTGQKTWAVGEEVLAPDFNTYVQTQVVAQFANAAARDAWAGPPQGALCVTLDDGVLWQRTPSAWRKPWGQPWGMVGQGADAAQKATSGATEMVAIGSTQFNAPGNRRYKITAEFCGSGTVQTDLIRFGLRRTNLVTGASIHAGPAWQPTIAGGYLTAFVVIGYDVPPANAAMQYMLGVARMSGTGVFTLAGPDISGYQNSLTVEDIGPAGVPV